jgi:hypothetical protein
MQELAKEFLELFSGSDIAHGTYQVNGEQRSDGKKQGQAKVLRQPPTLEHWVEHLQGGIGLGIIPIRSDNTCKWGAIDVDSYDTDHKLLVKKLRENKIPAIVGRSKSGGAHIWLFVKQYIPAADMQRKMTNLAAALGYADTEIFPKQTTILVDRGDTGNFLNMPYQSGDRTVRYAFDTKGESLTTEAFIAYAKKRALTAGAFAKLDVNFGTKETVLKEGPPCLQHLCRQGFTEGSRNNALFNLGVYARLFNADNWENLVQKYNVDHLVPPLSHSEVGTVIKQLHKKDYFYKCEDQPIKPFCNKEVCKTRKYGVGPAGISHELSSLTKIDGDPPIWILNVDEQRVELSTQGLISQPQFQKDCVSQINKFPATITQRAWQTRIQTLLDTLTIVEVPPDATLSGEFEDLLHSFCTERARGTEKEDILQGISVWCDNKVFFQVKDLRKHLTVNDFTHYTSNKITLKLRDLESDKTFWRVKGKGVHVWSLPQTYFGEEEVSVDLPPLSGEQEIL